MAGKSTRTQADYLSKYQDILRKTALEIFREDNPEIATHLDKVLKTQESKKGRTEKDAAYAEIMDSLSKEDQTKLFTAYGKLNDLARTARKLGSKDIVEIHHNSDKKSEFGASNADKFVYTLKTMAAQNPPVNPEYVQKVMDEMMASFSITPHPTNGTNVEHTKQGMAIENILDNKDAGPEELKDALRAYMNSEISGAKKTQEQETEEGIAVLDNIYDACISFKESVEEALKESGYAKKGVKVTNRLIDANAWFAGGDGDGNPNSTKESLESGIGQLRTRIKERYLEDLAKIGDAAADISKKLSSGKYSSPEEFRSDLEKAAEKDSANAKAFNDIAYKAKNFGFHYAKIDIRHDAPSIETTIARLVDTVVTKKLLKSSASLIHETGFEELSSKEKENMIAGWLENPDLIKAMQSLNPEDLGDDKVGLLAGRVFGRMQVIGKNPDMSEKLIIAEAKEAKDALAAMLLLTASGNEIANKNAKMNIVTLSESLPDLEELPNVAKTLANNTIYRKHLDSMGGMIAMVAESDNRRRAGFGAGEKIYETIGTMIRLGQEMGVPMRIFNGGGADLVRGAQTKPTEVGTLQGYYAKVFNAYEYHCPTFTIQGHQGRLLFSSDKVAAFMLEGIFSQAAYAKAGVEGEIALATLTPEKEQNRTKARQDAKIMHRIARDMFTQYTTNPSFDKLLYNAPWVSAILNNLSSRPSKRGGTDKGAGVTVSDIVGKNPQALAQRAITGSTVARLMGLFPLPVLGQKEGLEAVIKSQEEKGRPVNNIYDFSKPERNHIRGLAIILYNTNFDKSWQMLGGERPSAKEVETLAAKFDVNNKDNDERVTLAYMEQYALDTTKLAYKVIHGKELKKEFSVKDLLVDTWPDLAEQMSTNHKNIDFADFVEAKLTKEMNEDPSMVLKEEDTLLLKAIAASTTLRNTPVGMLGVYTSKYRDIHDIEGGQTVVKSSFAEKLDLEKTKTLTGSLWTLAKEVLPSTGRSAA